MPPTSEQPRPEEPTPGQPTVSRPFGGVEMNRPVSDPVCGQTVTRASAKASLDHAVGSVSLCSTECRDLHSAALRRP